MKEDPRQGLAALLDAFDRKQDEATMRADQVRTRQESFLDWFHSLRKKLIEPLMHQVGEQLAQRGHLYCVRVEEGSQQDNPGVFLDMTPVHAKLMHGEKAPHVGFIAHPPSGRGGAQVKAIWHGRSGGGPLGSFGELTLDELPEEKIMEVLLKGIKLILGV